MTVVLDSCVAVKWELTEIDSDKATRLRDEARTGLREFVAPDVFPAEFAHAITRAERQGRISPTEGAIAVVSMLVELPILHPTAGLLPRAYAISSTARIGIYDCLYVALAEREGCNLVTADDKLIKNLGGRFPFIVPLSTLP